MTLLFFLYCFTTAVFMLVEILYILRDRRIMMIDFCRIVFLIIEGVVPAFFHGYYLYTGVPYNAQKLDYTDFGMTIYWYVFAFYIVGYTAINLGYRVFSKKELPEDKNESEEQKQEEDRGDEPKAATVSANSYSKLRITTLVCLAIGAVSLVLWTDAFGGIFEFILRANEIRAGQADIVNPLAFFKHPAGVILIASYAAFVLLLKGGVATKLYDFAVWLLSFAVSVLYLLACDGRMVAGMYLVTHLFVIVYANYSKTKRMPLKAFFTMAFFMAAGLVFMVNMDTFTRYLKFGSDIVVTTSDGSTMDEIIYELMFVIRGMHVAVKTRLTSGLEYFLADDIMTGIFAWLPSSLTPEGFANIWTVNTNLLGETSGAYPVGLLAQGYYDLGILGVVIIAFLYGFLVRKIDTYFNEKSENNPFAVVMFVSFIFTFVRLIAYGSLYNVMLGSFKIVIFALVYFAFSMVFDVAAKKKQDNTEQYKCIKNSKYLNKNSKYLNKNRWIK